MKKRIAVGIVAMLLLCSLPSCGKKEEQPAVKKISDILYETTYDKPCNYSEICKEEVFKEAGLCSSIQYGVYRGRNLDWNYENDITYVFHVTKRDDRYANVSVSCTSFGKDVDTMYKRSVDGINSEGLCVNANVTDVGEIYKAKTETKDDDLFAGYVVRLLLDKCGSIEDCQKMLNAYDVYGTEEHEWHWMISGKKSKDDPTVVTAIAEMIYDEEKQVSRINWDIHEDNIAIMTNFKTDKYDGTRESTGKGFGYERYKILEENIKQAISNRGTFDLMRKVFYSLSYDMFADNYWYSEMNGTDLSEAYTPDELKQLLGNDVYNKCTKLDQYGEPHTYYDARYMKGEDSVAGNYTKMGVLERHTPVKNALYESDDRDGSCWITGHTSIFNVKDKTMAISVHEGVDLYYFNINPPASK